MSAALVAGGAMVSCGGETTTNHHVDAGNHDGDASAGSGGMLSGSGGASASGGQNQGTGGAGVGGVNIGGSGAGGGAAGGMPCDGAVNRTGVTLCRSSADCRSPANCVMSEPQRGCGNPAFEPQQCTVDDDCGDGLSCETTPCGGHVCSPVPPACTPENCNGANMCVNGVCTAVIVHCTEGGTCQDGYDCVEDAPGTGCVRRACTTDRDCDCGYCVNSFCEATLGFCYEIIAMPYGCVWPDEELV